MLEEAAEGCGGDAVKPLRLPRAPSQRAIRNSLAFMGGATTVEQAPPPRKTGRQKESLVNDAVKEWARYKNGVLYRNRRGMVVLASGAKMPIGLGPNGYGDLCGYLTIEVTPAMLGRRVAVYTMLESKVKDQPDPHQQTCIDEVAAAGGITGCVHNVEDAEAILANWRANHGA